MEWLSLTSLLQIIVALGLLNVWLVRRRSSTPFRGGAAQTLQEEFAAHGLPGFAFYLVGALKIGAACSHTTFTRMPACSSWASSTVTSRRSGAPAISSA